MYGNNAVVTICNDKYVKYAKVLIKSFYENNPEFEGDFVILYDNLYAHLNWINIMCLQHLHSNIRCVKVDSAKYHDLINAYYPYMCRKNYAICALKLEIFQMNYDKILFLDADMLVNKNIMQIFDIDCPAAAVEDYDNARLTLEKRDYQYFNGGLIYVTQHYNIEDILQYAINQYNGSKEFFEQDFLNGFFNDKEFYLLPYLYNIAYYPPKKC